MNLVKRSDSEAEVPFFHRLQLEFFIICFYILKMYGMHSNEISVHLLSFVVETVTLPVFLGASPHTPVPTRYF